MNNFVGYAKSLSFVVLVAVASCTKVDESMACSGVQFMDYCAPSQGGCEGSLYPITYTFSDGLLCGKSGVAIGGDIEEICASLGVGCQRAEELCPEPPPSLEECTSVTTTHADCGGTGGGVFGCSLNDGCRWFIGGCVPQNHRMTTCPSSDVCCHDDWPWPAGDSLHRSQAESFIHAFGTTAWLPGRELNVDVGAIPEELEPPAFTCSGVGVGQTSPCAGAFEATDTNVLGGGRRIVISPLIPIRSGFSILIELESGSSDARVCLLMERDEVRGTCSEATTASVAPPICASSGVVQIGGGGGYLDVQLGEVGQISGWW